jgi:uncharacterized protein (DUF1330 family)
VDDVIAAAATTGVTEPDRRRDMSAFAIAHLRTPQLNDDVFEYLERIRATLDPYEGRFRVHGATVEVIESDWPGTIVIIEFPDLDRAHAWSSACTPGSACSVTTARPTGR